MARLNTGQAMLKVLKKVGRNGKLPVKGIDIQVISSIVGDIAHPTQIHSGGKVDIAGALMDGDELVLTFKQKVHGQFSFRLSYLELRRFHKRTVLVFMIPGSAHHAVQTDVVLYYKTRS